MTVRRLEKITVDTFMVDVEEMGLTEVFVKQAEGKYCPAISLPPNAFQPIQSPIWQKLQDHAPKKHVEVYQHFFNGLTDQHQSAGQIRIDDMLQGETTLCDFDWFPEYAVDVNTDDYCELFSLGSAAGLLLNLAIDWSNKAPEDVETILYDKDWEFPKNVNFWSFISSGTTGALADD